MPDNVQKTKKKIAIIAIVSAAIVAAAVGGIAYALNVEHEKNTALYTDHLFANTYAGGVDVSGMTASEAKAAVDAALKDAYVVVKEDENETTFYGRDANVSDVDESFFADTIRSQEPEKWREFCGQKKDLTLPAVKYDIGALQEKVEKLECVSGEGREMAVDAKVVVSPDGVVSIEDSKKGTLSGSDHMTDEVLEKLTGGAYSAEKANEERLKSKNEAISNVTSAKNTYKERTAAFKDENENGYDDETDVVIADAKEDMKDAITDAKNSLQAAVSKFYDASGSYKGRIDDISGVVVPTSGAYLNAVDCYMTPFWKGDEKELADAKAKAEKWLKAEIDYTIDMIPHAEKVDAPVIAGFITTDETGVDVELSDEKVASWLRETCAKYDTVGTERSYTTIYGKDVTVSGGAYGWMTDEAGELPKLIADVESGEHVSRDMTYKQTAAGPKGSGAGEWGSTYIDVDIPDQQLRYIKDGEVIFECGVISGRPGKDTKRGVWEIMEKQKDYVMRGEIQANGQPEYVTETDRWMRVTASGIGIHSAPWQPSYGFGRPGINESIGSHGCLNVSTASAHELYDILDVGTPVIIHD